jgi:hypothetical protein
MPKRQKPNENFLAKDKGGRATKLRTEIRKKQRTFFNFMYSVA